MELVWTCIGGVFALQLVYSFRLFCLERQVRHLRRVWPRLERDITALDRQITLQTATTQTATTQTATTPPPVTPAAYNPRSLVTMCQQAGQPWLIGQRVMAVVYLLVRYPTVGQPAASTAWRQVYAALADYLPTCADPPTLEDFRALGNAVRTDLVPYLRDEVLPTVGQYDQHAEGLLVAAFYYLGQTSVEGVPLAPSPAWINHLLRTNESMIDAAMHVRRSHAARELLARIPENEVRPLTTISAAADHILRMVRLELSYAVPQETAEEEGYAPGIQIFPPGSMGQSVEVPYGAQSVTTRQPVFPGRQSVPAPARSGGQGVDLSEDARQGFQGEQGPQGPIGIEGWTIYGHGGVSGVPTTVRAAAPVTLPSPPLRRRIHGTTENTEDKQDADV